METTIFEDQILFQKSRLLCQSQFGRQPYIIEMSVHSAGISLMFSGLIDFEDQRIPDDIDKQYLHVFILLEQFISPILSKRIAKIFHKDIDHVFIDWQKRNNTAHLTFLFKDWQMALSYERYEGREQLHNEISRLTNKIEKRPFTVQSLWINPTRLLVIRTGLLIYLEKKSRLSRSPQSLRISKRKVELEYFKQKITYPQFVQQSLQSAYLDWTFDCNMSVLILQFN